MVFIFENYVVAVQDVEPDELKVIFFNFHSNHRYVCQINESCAATAKINKMGTTSWSTIKWAFIQFCGIKRLPGIVQYVDGTCGQQGISAVQELDNKIAINILFNMPNDERQLDIDIILNQMDEPEETEKYKIICGFLQEVSQLQNHIEDVAGRIENLMPDCLD